MYIIILLKAWVSESVSDSVSIKLKNYEWYHLEIFTHYSRNFRECTEIFWWPFIEGQGQHKFKGDCGVLFPKNLVLYHRLQSATAVFVIVSLAKTIGKLLTTSQIINHSTKTIFFCKNCIFACLIIDSYSV